MIKLPIFVRLSGGLGNQLYMLSLAWLAAVEQNRKVIIYETRIDNPQFSNRVFSIFDLTLTSRIASRIWKSPRNLLHTLIGLLSKLAQRGLLPGDLNALKVAKGFSSPIYFSSRIMCDSFWAAKARDKGFGCNVGIANPGSDFKELSQQLRERSVLGVHLRLTDIRTFEGGNRLLPPEYFGRNIDRIQNNFRVDEIWVFSDEPSGVLEFVKPNEALKIISEGFDLSVCEELLLMSKCEVLLCSRSTFSFWAGFWNKNQSNIFYPGEVPGFPMWNNSLL